MVRRLLLGIALALMAAAPAGAQDEDLSFAPTEAGNARAATAITEQRDLATLGLGRGIRWKGGRVKADELALPTCTDVPTTNFHATVVGLAKTSFEADNYQLNTQAELYATTPMARISLRAQTQGAQALACLRDSLTRSSTATHVISVERLAHRRIGDASAAFRVEFTEGAGPHHHFVGFVVSAIRGRMQTGILVFTYAKGSDSLQAPSIALVRALVARAKI